MYNTMLMCIGELNYVEWSRNGSNYYYLYCKSEETTPFSVGPVRHRTQVPSRNQAGSRILG